MTNIELNCGVVIFFYPLPWLNTAETKLLLPNA